MKKTDIRNLAIIGFMLVAHTGLAQNKHDVSEKNENQLPQAQREQCEVVQKHLFSQANQADTFKLIYNCKNLEDSMSFQIIDPQGILLYDLKFTGTSLYGYDRPYYEYITNPKWGADFDENKMSKQLTDSLQAADRMYLKNKMAHFFDEDRFMVNPSGRLNKEYLNVSNFDGIAADPTAIGYRIQLYSEGFEMIAYSKKLKKVQMVAAAD